MMHWGGLEDAADADSAAVGGKPSLPVPLTLTKQNLEAASQGDAAFEAITAALQLFDMCSPGEDSTISGVDLEKVLHGHLGRAEDVERIKDFLSEHETEGGRFNFLNYWQAVDRFFEEAGAFPTFPEADAPIDTIRGMQKFRDGVLAIHRKDPQEETIPATLLLNLLNGIRSKAEDSEYWDEVIQAIPDEEGFGLTMREVAEAVYIWLKDFSRGDDVGGQACGECGNVFAVQDEVCSACGAPRPAQELAQEVAHEVEQPANAAECTPGNMSPGEVSPVAHSTSLAIAADAPRKSRSRPALLHSTSLVENSGEVQLHMQRVNELTDLIEQRTPQDIGVVHEAVARLVELHKIFEKAWQDNQAELVGLRKSIQNLEEKRHGMESELSDSLHKFSELDHRFEGVEMQRDEYMLRATTLEAQVTDLVEQRDLLNAELRKFRAESESYHREKTEVRKKTLQLQDRMISLEKNADTAEGQVSWMRSELAKLRQTLAVSKLANRSYAGCCQEADEAAGLLQEQLQSQPKSGQDDGTSNGGVASSTQVANHVVTDNVARTGSNADSSNCAALSQEIEELEKQLGLQQVQLQRLRQVRDDLLKAHESWGSRNEEGSCSPRELQVHRRCSFLCAQLHALLQHARELECLLDDRCKEPDAKRMMSVQRVAEESKKAFGEFSEKLHTLEVQKEAVEIELRRLQTQLAEKENQLRTVQRHRDQLLVDAGAQSSAKDEISGTRSTVSSSSSTGTASAARPSGADPAFLFGSARPAEGQLRHSPKDTTTMEKGVKTLVHAQHSSGNDPLKRHTTTGARSQAHGFHISVASAGGNSLAVPGSSLSQSRHTFDFSAPGTSEMREKSEQRHSKHRERSRRKEEKDARREKRDRRSKEEDMFTSGVKQVQKEATCDQQ